MVVLSSTLVNVGLQPPQELPKLSKVVESVPSQGQVTCNLVTVVVSELGEHCAKEMRANAARALLRSKLSDIMLLDKE